MCNPDQDIPPADQSQQSVSTGPCHPCGLGESIPPQSSTRIPWIALANQSQGSTDRISDSGGTKFTGVSGVDFPRGHTWKTSGLQQTRPKCRGSARGAGRLWALAEGMSTALVVIKDFSVKGCLRPAFYFNFSIRNIIYYAGQGLEEISVQNIT